MTAVSASPIMRAARFINARDPHVNLLGLGIIIGVNADLLQAGMRTDGREETGDNRFLSDTAIGAISVGALGILASPHVAKLLLKVR